MIKAKVSNEHKDIERIFAGGSIQKEILKVWSTEADAYVFEAWKVLEMEGALPLTFNANGKALIDYRIYGAEGGVGVEAENNEPTGYKLPMITKKGNNTTITPIYVGNKPLEKDEYVSFSEGKIYRLGENIADWSKGVLYHCTQTNNADGSVTLTKNDTTAAKSFGTTASGGTDVLGFKLGSRYVARFNVVDCNFTSGDGITPCCTLRQPTGRIVYRDTQPLYVLGEHTFAFTYDFEGVFGFLVTGNLSNSSVTIADLRVQEVIEEEPPVPLPEIPTYKGTTILDFDGEEKHLLTSDGYELVDKNQNGFLLSGSLLRPEKAYVKYKGR